MLIKGGALWEMNSDEVIIRIPGSKFIRIMPDPLNLGKLRYDEVIEIAEDIWASIPEFPRGMDSPNHDLINWR